MSSIAPTFPASPPLRHAILGTAGHIDHGKSSLVKALTGTDPDRLPEEKSRGMTIELGFARLDLPGVRLGIVDVPGHERFIRTMVAGATCIDIALLVVAADDGPMPQTSEHIDILHLLGVTTGLIAINKSDLVDADRIVTVSSQLRDLTAATPLANWPHLAVSATRGDGLENLKSALDQLATTLAIRPDAPLFRMAIDRVFAIRGRGTVVTGSVMHGLLREGQSLELLPAARTVKVREIQSHGLPAAEIRAGQRAALNLTGLDRDQIVRGDELATPGYLAPARYVDARVRLSPLRSRPLPSHRRVRVSMGTREELARLVCLDGLAIAPGNTSLVQLRFDAPVVTAHDQRLILRDESAAETIGCAVVLRPASRRARPAETEVAALRLLESDDPATRIDAVLRQSGFDRPSDIRIAALAGVDPRQTAATLDDLRRRNIWLTIANRECHVAAIDDLCNRALAHLDRHHARRPTEPGILNDRFIGWLDARSAPGCGRQLLARLQTANLVRVLGPYVARAAFRPALSAADAALLQKLVAAIVACGLDPPAWNEIPLVAALSKQRAAMLLELARTEPLLVQLGPGQYIAADALARLKDAVRHLGHAGRRFRLAEVRDTLNLSRRSVLPLLEYLDRIGFTRRVGDERIFAGAAT